MNISETKIWKSRIERAKSLQAKQHNLWRDSVDLYNCTFFDKYYGGFSPERVDVHFANWYVNNFIPLVYFRDPYIFVKGRSSVYSGFGSTLETAVNVFWKKLAMKQQFKRVILSAALMPPGWIKVGYTAKIGQDVAKLEEIKQKDLINRIKESITGVFKKKPEELTPEEQGVLNEYIEEESIFANWIPSWNILMPEGYQLVKDMPYLIEIEDLPKVDFMANTLYSNKGDAKEARSISTDESGGTNVRKPTYNKLGSNNAGAVDEETSIIRLYHIWDRRSNKRIVLSDYSNDPHFVGDWSYDFHGFPYEPLIFDETLPSLDQSNPYPPNILQPILPQILEQSNARTQMVNWRKRASSLILAQRGLATEEDLRQLEETDGVQICLVSNIGAYQMSQTSNLPGGVFDVNEIINQDLQMGTNMGQLMFAPMAGQRTATQAQIGQSGLQLKSSARIDVIEDFTVNVAKKLCLLLWQFYSKEQISEIIGEPVTDNMWIPLPEDMKERKRIMNSEIQFRIDAGSTAAPKDETVDRKQLLDYASIVSSIAPERIKKDEFIKQLTNKFKFVKDVDKIVIGMDDEETQTAMQENEYMMQGMPQSISPNENHEIHIKVHSQVPPNDIIDQHIAEHGMRLGIIPGANSKSSNQQNQQGNPQEGDIRPPTKSVAPQITREGQTESSDIYQSVQNAGEV